MPCSGFLLAATTLRSPCLRLEVNALHAPSAATGKFSSLKDLLLVTRAYSRRTYTTSVNEGKRTPALRTWSTLRQETNNKISKNIINPRYVNKYRMFSSCSSPCILRHNNGVGLNTTSQPQWRTYSVSQSSEIQQLNTAIYCNKRITPRFFSANATFQSAAEQTVAAAVELPVLSPPPVGFWLLLTTALVYAVIVVGGVTRLTESGLSITEWKPVSGVLPPLSHAEWEGEFDKYKATPEFKLLNSNITLEDFKRIFYMEWGHRILGRVVGLAFVVPLAYFAARRQIPPALTKQLIGIAFLLGLQGALGWYMVKSGLEDTILTTPGAVPRVSQYRLAAHLAAAFILYASMFATAHNIMRDWKYVHTGKWSGFDTQTTRVSSWEATLRNPLVRRFRRSAWALTALVFVTAISGAFVAGLDAGLLYNEFPFMGDRLIPPSSELFSPMYSRTSDPHSNLWWWHNLFENPTTVQFNHRLLAMTTYAAISSFFIISRMHKGLRAALPPATRRTAMYAFGMVNVQAALGITTLWYLVPVPLAAAHQAGSVALLSLMLWLGLTLRRPGAVALLWRRRTLMQQRQNVSSAVR